MVQLQTHQLLLCRLFMLCCWAACRAAKTSEEFQAVLGKPAKLSGPSKKEGFLPLSRWDNGTWDHTPFWQWALDEVAYAVGDSSQGTAAPSKSSQGEAVRPPAAAPCELWISPQQKIVLVVHRGPAATVLLHASGLCHDPRGVKAQACFRRVTQADARAAGGDKAFWQSHRVIAVARNVYAHAAAVYDTQTRRWPMPVGVCSPPPFNVYCKDPTVLGRMGNIFRCSPNSWEHTLWTAEFAATDPQHHCLLGEGGLAVDYMLRAEHLVEDAESMLQWANKGRPSGSTALSINKQHLALQAKVFAPQHRSLQAYAELYTDCGQGCLNAISSYYAGDILLLGPDAT